MYFSLLNHKAETKKINLDKLKKGDKEEQEKMILKFLPLIKKKSYINGVIDEDLMQELIVFILTKAIETFDQNKNIKFITWVYILVENKKNNYLKKKKYRNHLSYEECILNNCFLSENYNFEKDFIEQETKYILRQFIQQLKPDYQYIISKYYGFGCERLTLTEIGERMGCSHETIRQKLIKSNKQLKKKLLWEGIY